MDKMKGKKGTPKSQDHEKQINLPEDVQSGSAKRKSRGEVEPRTPLKRQRVPVQKFQSPADELIPMPSTSKQKETLEMLHKKGSFLGVRGEEGTFYLCKTIQNVFTNTRKFKIQWLDLDQPPDVYKLDFVDTTDADCILTNVKMDRVEKDTYKLPIKEQTRVEEILRKALLKERGEPVDDIIIPGMSGSESEDEVMEEDEEESEEEEWEEEETPKKPKSTPKSKKTPASAKGKGSKSKPEKGKKTPVKENKVKPEKKKGPDKDLKPNTKIKVLEKEPFFETKEKVEFMSKFVQGKLAIRAVLLNDMKLLQSLMEDHVNVYDLSDFRSVDIKRNALHYAIEQKNKEAIRLLVKDFSTFNERKKKGSMQSVLISKADTGRYNPMSLGVRAIRKISQSRGSREGNDAFVKDIVDGQCDHELTDYVEDALKLGIDQECFTELVHANKDSTGDLISHAVSNVYQAVLSGNRKLAGHLVEQAMKESSSGFGYLHKDVLLFDKEELRSSILAASVKKKPYDNKSITPLHCAAINPNVAYLKRLLAVEPNMNLEDRDHRRPIHFAAVCEGVGPLEFLLERGASPLEVDNQGMTPLHYACYAGRPRNVDILLRRAKAASQKQGDVFSTKWGPGGVDRPCRSSFCPVHMAVHYSQADVLKILIKHQVDVNKPLSAGKNRVTCLMVAASHGDLEICRILGQNGAYIDQVDKLKRSALIHAVMNGNTHVASFLLHLGANPNRCDSSGNSVAHYAAAYGWIFCLKLLHQAGADLGKASDWQTTPISIAFLKGHVGIVDYLLKQSGVDINFKDDAGMTLTSVAVSSALEPGLYDQVKHLLSKGANPTITDVNNMDSLHHLAKSEVLKPKPQLSYWNRDEADDSKELDETKVDLTVRLATLLLDAGCDPTLVAEDGKTALMLAIEQLNVGLVKLLVERGGIVTSHKTDDGRTILHHMVNLCMDAHLAPILKILVEQKPITVKPPRKDAVKEDKDDRKEKMVVENGDNGEDQKPEKMEVDGEPGGPGKREKGSGEGTPPAQKDGPKQNGSGDGGETVNGMDVDEQPPALEKMVSVASQEDIWQIMATELDHEGYMPLLLACKVYRGFKKGKMAHDAVKKCSENGRNFIKALIELTAADVSETVKEIVFPGNPPESEAARYTKDGKCSALHMLLHVGHEVLEGLECAGLQLLCEHSPKTECRNLHNKTPIIDAVEDKNVKAVHLLIKAGANVNVTFGNEIHGHITPLHKAADIGDVSLVRALIKSGANVNAVNTKSGETPLHMAVHNRVNDSFVIEIAQLLLEAGADINMGKFTALHAAVLANTGKANASTELEEFLLARGANVLARDEKNRLPLHYAFISQSDPESRSRVDPIELVSVLVDAMGGRDLDSRDTDGRTSLHLAATRGATISCVHLLQRKVPLLAADNKGHTALSLAVKHKHDSCAIVLLQKGAKVDTSIVIPAGEPQDWRNYYENPASDNPAKEKIPIWSWIPFRNIDTSCKDTTFDIYEAAISGELQGVAHMVLDSTGLTGRAIESAMKVKKYHIALRHLQRVKDAKVVTGYRNQDKQNLLHTLAQSVSRSDLQLQLKVGKVLLEKGVSMSDLDTYGRVPLVYAALLHQPLDMFKFFLDNTTADLNQKDKFGRTVLVALFWNQTRMHQKEKNDNRFGCLKLLLDKCASVEVPYAVSWPPTPLFDVCMAGALLDFNKPGEGRKMTPLVASIYNDDEDLVRFLLKNGANPNMPDENGLTPIMHAVRVNCRLITKILLDYDYKEKQTGSADDTVPQLKKKFSRQVFAVTAADGAEDDDDDDDEDNDDDKGTQENDDDENEGYGDATDDEEQDEENVDEDAGMDDDGSDHDTDVVDDDDEDEGDRQLALPRLGSKQPSMRRVPTSIENNKDEFEVVVKTSPVNLAAVDNAGRNVVHHLVCPMDYGTFECEDHLYMLARAGAPLDIKDAAGDTPLQLALKNGAPRLVKRLQSLLKVESEKQEKVTYSPFKKENQGSSPVARKYEKDAEEMLKKITPAPDEDGNKNVRCKVDQQCMAAVGGEVEFDKTQGLPYDVILSKIEVRSLLSDTYNFYKMQIIYHKAKSIYILFTKWGRIGDSGQYQQTPYQNLSEAVTSFCQIFKSKTGNKWTAVKEFVSQPKKYTLVKTEQPQSALRVDFKLESSIPSRLSTAVQALFKELGNVEMMQAALLKSKMAEEYMPFGRIERNNLIKARLILQEIGEMVVETEKRKQNMSFDSNEHQKYCNTISTKSTTYYNLVPMEGYAYDRIEPLHNISAIRNQMRLISTLLDLETASKMMLGAQYHISDVNPLDYLYESTGCTVEPLREEDVESQYILKYMLSSNTTQKVLCMYRLQRPGEDEREKFRKLDNHRLLWHGTATSNVLSILKNGLLVAPPEAPITGAAFGEGIYTADTFDKSSGYCSNYSSKSDIKCAFLCEVALGNLREEVDNSGKLDMIHSEYNSLLIHGRTFPKQFYDVTLPYGAVMPAGYTVSAKKWMSPEGEVNRCVPYNEYIVQDSEQIALRYLIQFVD
ncbi:poly [ADP-ribose] polymerase tankyrase-like isoform X2 [Mya arenaria]|uniref:poly [ADP-ribose] polymerase tankyrase-like isoform X2 n=1 Tax=Mya arenaria TaxID=6604 RepID=UPI0022E87A2A|nr:poly [ADP-ribose] polymerase tankyrase-like isoform X2 [Mya arenaria]